MLSLVFRLTSIFPIPRCCCSQGLSIHQIGEPFIPSLFGDAKISNSIFDIFNIISIFIYTTFSYSTAGQAPVEGPTGFGQGLSNDSSHGLPPPTLNGSRPQPTNEDEPTAQPAPDHTTEPPTLPAARDAPTPTLLFTVSLEAMHDHGPTTTPHLHITIHLLKHYQTQKQIR